MTVPFEMTDYVAPKVFGGVGRTPFGRVRDRYTFESDAERTTVRVESQVVPEGPFRIITPLLAGLLRLQFRIEHRRLKAYLEGR